MEVHLDGIQCAASVDTGCSRTHMSRSFCSLWRKRELKVLTVDRKTEMWSWQSSAKCESGYGLSVGRGGKTTRFGPSTGDGCHQSIGLTSH